MGSDIFLDPCVLMVWKEGRSTALIRAWYITVFEWERGVSEKDEPEFVIEKEETTGMQRYIVLVHLGWFWVSISPLTLIRGAVNAVFQLPIFFLCFSESFVSGLSQCGPQFTMGKQQIQ